MLNFQKIWAYIVLKSLKTYWNHIRIVYTLIILVILTNVKIELFLYWGIFLNINVFHIELLMEICLWTVKEMASNQGFLFFSVALFMSKSNTSFNT